MARPRLPQQQELLRDVLAISHVREDLERLLEHVIKLQSGAVALAGAYGATQTDLAVVANLSRQRIGQLFDQTDTSALTQKSLEAQIHQVEEWPGDVMGALALLARGGATDDVEHRDRLRRQVAIAYGQDEADRRHKARSAFLASLETDQEAASQITEATERARRTVAGSS